MRALLSLLLLAACSPDAPNDIPRQTVDDPGKGPIDDAPLFDPDHLVEVQVELASTDLEILRDQTRDFFEELSGDCTAQPFGSPFTWFEGEVVVDGETIPSAGVRKKGFLGSMSWEKPSLKVSTDEFVDEQLMANGTERLTLNNNVQDPSVIKQCLGYGVFAAAGMPAPRCNFALVSLNGEPHGIYSHVEDVKKDFLRRHFEDDDGDLYEGTLSDFHPDWMGTFDPKTNDTDPDKAILADVSAALDLPAGQRIAALDEVVELDAFFRFWAMESLIAHWDGYSGNQNNFLVYKDPPTDKLSFIPWGTDQVLDGPDAPAVFLVGRMHLALWETQEGRDRYLAAMDDLLATAWDEAALHAEVDRMQALLEPHVNSPEEMAVGLENVRAFIDQRRANVEAQLAELQQAPLEPMVLRDPFCVNELGPFTATFDTVWDSLEDDAFLYSATHQGGPIPPGALSGAIAGRGDYDEYVVATVAVNADFTTAWQTLVVLPPDIGPGVWPVGFEFGQAILVQVDLTDPYAEGDVLGIVMGEVTLDQAGNVTGEPVVGSVTGTLLDGPW